MTTQTAQTQYAEDLKAWVGCLGCYNAGELRGEWMDVDQVEDFLETTDACALCESEEFWCFDLEDPWGIDLREMGPSTFFDIARELEHYSDEEIRMCVRYCKAASLTFAIDYMAESQNDYFGYFPMEADLAHYCLEEGLMGDVDFESPLMKYVDLDRLGHDIAADLVEEAGHYWRL